MRFSSFICSPIDMVLKTFFPFSFFQGKNCAFEGVPIFSRSFIILGFIFRSVIYVNFYMKYEAGIHVNYLLFHTSSWKSYRFSPLCFLWTFVINQLSVYMWIFFFFFPGLALIYLSIFISVPHFWLLKLYNKFLDQMVLTLLPCFSRVVLAVAGSFLLQ